MLNDAIENKSLLMWYGLQLHIQEIAKVFFVLYFKTIKNTYYNYVTNGATTVNMWHVEK